jgi:hypothetical protein
MDTRVRERNRGGRDMTVKAKRGIFLSNPVLRDFKHFFNTRLPFLYHWLPVIVVISSYLLALSL